MKPITFLTAALLFMLAACSGGPQPDPTATSPSAPTEPAGAAPTDTPQGYPAAPAPTEAPGDYPAAPTQAAAPNGYPADMPVWVLLPLGEQCVDPETYEYADLQAAVGALEDVGVEVMASETVELGVCEACDCPTSEHFRVQIQAQDLAGAESLGWSRE